MKALALLFATGLSLAPASTLPDGIRSVNFNEFSYRVGLPFCEEFGPTVRVHQGKFGNERDQFEVTQVLYGKLTDSGQEEAAVVTSCGPKVPAHPGFENDLVYVYGMEHGQPNLLATFAGGQPVNFQGVVTEARRQDRLILFDVIGVTVGAGSISFERMAGEARCCPTFRLAQTFRWSHGGFVLAGERKEQWKETQTPSANANGVQIPDQDARDFAERYGWYAASVRRRITQNWLQSTIDPAVRAARTAHTVMTFTINRDGSIRNVQLAQSSGNPSMDNSARHALDGIQFGPLPNDYNGSFVSMTFDFRMDTQ